MDARPAGDQLAKVVLLFIAVAALNAFRRGELGSWTRAKFLNWGDPTPTERRSLASLLVAGAASVGSSAATGALTGSAIATSGASAGDPADLVTVGTTRMSKRFAARWVPMAAAAQAEGIVLTGGAYRSRSEQIRLREAHGCGGARIDDRSCKGTPPTAVPGMSRHETGDAIDVKLSGPNQRTSPEYLWLQRNANRYGIYNLPSEPWHWSIDGK